VVPLTVLSKRLLIQPGWSVPYLFLGFGLFVTLVGKKHDRYLLPIFPLLTLVAALGWEELGRSAIRRIGVGTRTPGVPPYRASRLWLVPAILVLLQMSLVLPYVFSRHTSAVFSVFAEQQTEFQAYLRRAVGGDVSVTRRTRWDVPITASYSASYGTTKADPATFCALLNVCRATDTEVFGQSRLRSTLSLALVRDRANSPLNPTAGTVLALDIRWASEILGSDSLARFLKGVAEFTSYHPLGRRTVAAWRVRIGGTRVPTIGFSGGAERFLTPEERFFGGGPNSVRGFTQNELGPTVYVLDVPGADPDTAARASPTGGVAVALLNAELRFPLTRRGEHFFGALFVDAGQVANRFRDAIDPADLRVTPGLGFRVTSPLGPIRLDMAYNPYEATSGPLYENQGIELVLVEEEYQPPARSFLERWRIHFSVGQAF